jgi:hypothetical protein
MNHYQKLLQGESRYADFRYTTLTEDEAAGFFAQIGQAMRRYKDAILNMYDRLVNDPEAQVQAYEKVKRKFGLVEEALMGEGLNDVTSSWQLLLEGIFGAGKAIAVLTLSALVLAAEVWGFTWLFGTIGRGIIATILFSIVKASVYDQWKGTRQ